MCCLYHVIRLTLAVLHRSGGTIYNGCPAQKRRHTTVVTTYNQSRDHGEQRLGSYLDTLKSEHLCATSLDRDTSVNLGGPETVPGTSSRAPTTSATQRDSTRALLMRSFPRAPCGSGTCEIPTHKRLAVRNSDPQHPGSLSCLGMCLGRFDELVARPSPC
jgi:hypothetical protein